VPAVVVFCNLHANPWFEKVCIYSVLQLYLVVEMSLSKSLPLTVTLVCEQGRQYFGCLTAAALGTGTFTCCLRMFLGSIGCMDTVVTHRGNV
jgi:hypothetical protein